MKTFTTSLIRRLLVVTLLALALAVQAQNRDENTLANPEMDQGKINRLELIKKRYPERFAKMDEFERKMFLEHEAQMIKYKETKLLENKISQPPKGVSDNSRVNTNDSLALVALYNATDGLNWYDNTNWLIGPVNTWYGITVINGFITGIDLYQNNLTGNLPLEIGNLSKLQNLQLQDNEISGSIPFEIGNLSNLQYLNFWFNEFSGNIPSEIGNLTNLLSLDLSWNHLTGAIPPTIGYLTMLIELNLYLNQLSGSIPVDIANLSNLKYLWLSSNQLTGIIPAEIDELQNLMLLLLDDNLLESPIPQEICTLPTNLSLTLNLNNFGLEDCQVIRCLIERGGWGSISHSPQTNGFNFTNDCVDLTDEIYLTTGWNLVSLDLIPTPATPDAVFAPLISANNLQMVTGFQNQQGVFFDPTGLPFLNTLQNIVPGEGYWAKVTNGTTLSVTGTAISPTFAINPKAGWNLICYWPAETITPETAFAPLITAGKLQMVTSYEQGGKFYDPNGLPFLNTLTEIKNGFGYWVKMSADFNNFSYSQTPWLCGDNFTDGRDGKVYTTVQIGTQCWMKQNLNIGSRIDGTNVQTNNGTIEKYCYDDVETNCDIYGGLYRWDEMMQYTTTAGVKGICPINWQLPTDAEWTALTNFLGGVDFAGGKIKETGFIHWTYPNYGATNSSGFTGLPGSRRNNVGWSSILGDEGYFWSSTQLSASNAWFRSLSYYDAIVYRYYIDESFGFSVRCLKDESPSLQLEVNPPNQNVTESACETNFNIASNTTWSVTENNSWLSVSPLGGSNNGLLTVIYVENTSTDPRVGQIIITAEGGIPSVTVSIIQEGFSPFSCGQSFTDSRDCKTYTTVQIGTQCWMRQNLNIGDRIVGSSNQANNGIIEKYCYNNSESNCDVYGGLYQWDEMMQYYTTPGTQGICPSNWHLPTDAEWTAITTYLGGESVAGRKMKEAGTIHWLSPNTGANNSSGFTGLPAGGRYSTGSFYYLGTNANLWSSTEYSGSNAWYRSLYYGDIIVYRFDDPKVSGFSVRCLKDN
jgi:uncharacterized protein (TIGR02145 family)